MTKVDSDKYLGNVVSSDCQNKLNIEARGNRGMGIISQIMMLLEEVPLGHHYFECAVLLRESLLINSILVNIEVSYGLTKSDIETLHTVDKILLHKILQAHSGTPVEALFLSLGCIPVKYIIMARRLNFLHYILNRPDSDLVKRFYLVQSKYPVKEDWVHTVNSNIEELKLNLNTEEIRLSFKKCLKVRQKLGTRENLKKFENLKILNLK